MVGDRHCDRAERRGEEEEIVLTKALAAVSVVGGGNGHVGEGGPGKKRGERKPEAVDAHEACNPMRGHVERNGAGEKGDQQAARGE